MDTLAAHVGALVVGDAGAGTVSLTDGAVADDGAVRADGEGVLRHLGGRVHAGTPHDGEPDIRIGATGEVTVSREDWQAATSEGGPVTGATHVATGGAFSLGTAGPLTGDLFVAEGAAFRPVGERGVHICPPSASGVGRVTVDGDGAHNGTTTFTVGAEAPRDLRPGWSEPTVADQVVVTGHAQLSGTIQVELRPYAEDSVEFIRAAGARHSATKRPSAPFSVSAICPSMSVIRFLTRS